MCETSIARTPTMGYIMSCEGWIYLLKKQRSKIKKNGEIKREKIELQN